MLEDTIQFLKNQRFIVTLPTLNQQGWVPVACLRCTRTVQGLPVGRQEWI
jgi:hypothetical protein